MTWFEELVGFPETSPSVVHENLVVDDNLLASRANGREFACGHLETLSLDELRRRLKAVNPGNDAILVREEIADVQALHREESNTGALFQVASQFNLLEMASPGVTPEQGVGIYESDFTQGPACAIAAGAGTIYRNYFVPVNGRTGQSEDNQIDCLRDLGHALGNEDNRLWKMRNGYAMASRTGLLDISDRLRDADEDERDELRQLLRVGMQWETQVTLRGSRHRVSQAYCSALPVAYAPHPAELWEDFARLVLEAAYEATLIIAVLNAARTGNNRVYLTLLGGGAFGNEVAWITDSIERALRRYRNWGLDVAIVSYGRSKPPVRELVTRFT